MSRRSLLLSVGAVGTPAVLGAGHYANDRSFDDTDDDGIPDHVKRSNRLDARLRSLYGSNQFEGLERNRADLLLDVRYVEGTDIDPKTKRDVVRLFRDNGIYAQWLDYPVVYERSWFENEYGADAKALLWGRDSFYRNEVESFVKNIAIQVFVVPGRTVNSVDDAPTEGLVFSPFTKALGGGRDGHVNGFSVGNRAVVADRSRQRDEARLVLHEIAHYGLCHDNDPENVGVMGSGAAVDLMPHEWVQLRERLPNVRDTTGYDVALRPCLWKECLSDMGRTASRRGTDLVGFGSK